MRDSVVQIVLGIAASAVLGGIFAIASNFIFAAQLIGFSIVSALIIGAIFGAVGALLITIAAVLSKKSSKFFFLSCGIAYGALAYLLNVYFGFNAGFSFFGILLVSGFGLMSGIGSLFSHNLCSGLSRLQYLS